MKIFIMQVTYTLNDRFVVLLSYIERRWLLKRNLATIVPFNPNSLENFRVWMLLMKALKCLKILEFPKISNNMKKSQIIYEAKTASRLKEIIQPPLTKWKHSTSLEQKISYGDIQEYIDICYWKCFENAVYERLEMIQCKSFIWHHPETGLLENM